MAIKSKNIARLRMIISKVHQTSNRLDKALEAPKVRKFFRETRAGIRSALSKSKRRNR